MHITGEQMATLIGSRLTDAVAAMGQRFGERTPEKMEEVLVMLRSLTKEEADLDKRFSLHLDVEQLLTLTTMACIGYKICVTEVEESEVEESEE